MSLMIRDFCNSSCVPEFVEAAAHVLNFAKDMMLGLGL